MQTKPTIGVIGLSHLGIVESIGFASMGFKVVGVDIDKKTVDSLQKGDSILPEPGLGELFSKYKSNVTFSTDFSLLNQCQVVFLAKDTPVDEEKNEMALDRVWELVDLAIPHLAPSSQFVVMSQVPPGFTRSVEKRIQEIKPGMPFSIYYFVETLVIGDAVARFLKPERMVFGSKTPKSPLGGHLEDIVKRFPCPSLIMRLESAEMTKSAMNVYLATTVAFANTLANICEAVGADSTEVIPAMRLDYRVGQHVYITPGLGLSGGHLERDVVMLSHLTKKLNIEADLISVVNDINSSRYGWLRDRIEKEIFTHTKSPKIAIWGLSYKKNTDSTHGAPSLKVIRDFGKKASIVAYDPLVTLPGISCVKDKYEALKDADALLVLSNWDEFREIDLKRVKKEMKRSLIIDGLGVLNDFDFSKDDIRYIVMGRANL